VAPCSVTSHDSERRWARAIDLVTSYALPIPIPMAVRVLEMVGDSVDAARAWLTPTRVAQYSASRVEATFAGRWVGAVGSPYEGWVYDMELAVAPLALNSTAFTGTMRHTLVQVGSAAGVPPSSLHDRLGGTAVEQLSGALHGECLYLQGKSMSDLTLASLGVYRVEVSLSWDVAKVAVRDHAVVVGGGGGGGSGSGRGGGRSRAGRLGAADLQKAFECPGDDGMDVFEMALQHVPVQYNPDAHLDDKAPLASVEDDVRSMCACACVLCVVCVCVRRSVLAFDVRHLTFGV